MKQLLIILLLLCPFVGQAQKQQSKYLAGAVPVVNGMVVFSERIPANGLSKAERFERMQAYVTQIVDVKDKLPNSRITQASLKEGVIAASVQEYLWFKRNSLVWDRTQFFYQLVVQVEDDATHIMLRNLRYYYEGAETPNADLNYRAEDWITDAEALKKGGKKLTRVAGRKFRVKTIDRKDEIIAGAVAVLK